MRTTLAAAVVSLLLAACSPQPSRADLNQTESPSTAAANHSLTACLPSQLAIRVDAGNGRFNGMSHSGATLVLRNIGTATCTIPTQPTVEFTDINKQALDITRQGSPDSATASKSTITLVPGGGVSSDLRWVSGNVYENGHGEFPAYVTLEVGGRSMATTFVGHLWGAAGKPPTYTQTSFKPAEASVSSTAVKPIVYTCADGRSIQAAYPDTSSAVIILDGQTHRLRSAISASGARYVGDQWQWWTKGMHNAQLAPLKPGEKIASARDVSCHAP